MTKTDVLAIASPGSRPLKWAKHEKYCRLRASLVPRAQAYREAGWEGGTDISAYNHACRFERRPGVKARIEFLSHQAEELIAVYASVATPCSGMASSVRGSLGAAYFLPHSNDTETVGCLID